MQSPPHHPTADSTSGRLLPWIMTSSRLVEEGLAWSREAAEGKPILLWEFLREP
jgi:hypothetical protein